MKKCILITFICLVSLIVPSVLVIAQNSNQTEKPSAIENAMTEREKQIEEMVRDGRKKRFEQKKEVFKERNIDVNSITPRQIEELIDSNALTIDDVENLFPEEKLMKVRVSKTFRADKDNDMALLMPVVIGEALYELKYYVGEIPSGKMTPKLKDAIKDFQQSLGNEPTGELLFGEFKELTDRYDKLNPKRIGLPGYNFFALDGYVKVEGTWVFKGGMVQGIPIQTSVIELDKNTMSGVEAMASIFEGNDSLLTADIIRWKITKWSTEEIMAENDAPLNASYTLTVDLKNEKAYMFRRHKGEKIFGKVELEASVLELVDGFKVSYDLHQKRQKEANKLYNPKYKNVIEQLSQAATKDSIKAK